MTVVEIAVKDYDKTLLALDPVHEKILTAEYLCKICGITPIYFLMSKSDGPPDTRPCIKHPGKTTHRVLHTRPKTKTIKKLSR